MRKRFSTGIVFLILGCATVVSARGRKPDYEDRPVYVPPVRRGSAANHNVAFSPPKFDNDPFAPHTAPVKAEAGNAPPAYNYGYDKTGTTSHTAPAAKSLPLPPTSTVLPSNTDGLQAPAPHPSSKIPVAPADQGVPSLPGFDAPTSGTPAAPTDGLQAPDVHPTPVPVTTPTTSTTTSPS